MLEIVIPKTTFFNEIDQTFIDIPLTPIKLEHSLVSISKWEAKWHKPFLGDEDKTTDELISYIKCMTLTQNVNPDVYLGLTPEIVQQVCDYIKDPMTATTITTHETPDRLGGSSRNSNKIITSEVIYSWMISLQIPSEYQRWHINRLLTLIRVCNINNQPNKKMGAKENMNYHKSLNEARRAAAGI